ncbi:MAG TPA: RtcB family protein [Polyangiaceae bacterium]|nr:RtcB family protein [Polyangiaceae bacterium]
MTHSTINGDRVPIHVWAPIQELESDAIRQLKAVASLPWVAHHVAVMPDVHVGKGATVGSVIALRGAVAPAAVGVDIGCGMAAQKTSLSARDLPDSLRKLRLAIEAAVPVGRAHHPHAVWDEEAALRNAGSELMARFAELEPSVQRFAFRAGAQIGTLGGGNHFIELCLDTEDNVWLMLHSGSRLVGAMLAEWHMERASKLAHNQALVDRDLAVFLAGTPQFDAYRRDLFWAQEYAAFNRAVMLARVQRVLKKAWPRVRFEAPVSCHHNYVAEEVHFGEELLVTRKGAIRAGLGELGIIPGSMGAKSFIVRGLGNALSFESASHGAGRRMSRSQAKKSFTVADLQHQTEGVECRKDRGVIDEAPKAYKNIDRVMAQQADLVEIVAELKQVLCVKG